MIDPLGSTVALTDSSGNIQSQYAYEPFGAVTMSGQANANPYQFTGRENDSPLPLYYYRARYYSPTFSRFTTQDPIDFAGGDANLYRYATDNPLALSDPSGLKTFELGFSGTFLVGDGFFAVGATGSHGIVVDSQGNVGTYTTVGGLGGEGAGGSLSGGVDVQVSSADTINGIQGVFFEGQINADGVSGDAFFGASPTGDLVVGGGGVFGLGAGVSAQGLITDTSVTPLFNVYEVLSEAVDQFLGLPFGGPPVGGQNRSSCP